MDNAATTNVTKEVLEEMRPYLIDNYGNPSAQYNIGVEAKKAIQKARERVANGIRARPEEIYFTSCGSESDNWAIKGVCEKQRLKDKNKIITTNIEHPAVLNTCKYLEKHGFEVIYIPVDKNGFITAQQVENVIDDDTAIVSVMYANNEIGSIQPVSEIGVVCRRYGVPLHVDAVQAIGNVDINVSESNIDLMSISGHKIHAPKGVGCLYIRNGIDCSPLIHGGGQENGFRSGTENVASIVGFGKAMETTTSDIKNKIDYVKNLRDYLLCNIVDGEFIKLNGSIENRLCGNLNVSFKNCEGESIALQLANYDIYVSAKSACSAGNLEPSHVIKAIEKDENYLYGSVRFSLNEHNTQEEIDYLINTIKKLVIFNQR